tara:strand:- start:3446 stop:3628 length:183 start_codon:yes stop_codon:yes gene_type:complete
MSFFPIKTISYGRGVVPWRGRRVAVSGLRRPDAAFLGILEKYRFLQYGPAKVAGAEETDR